LEEFETFTHPYPMQSILSIRKEGDVENFVRNVSNEQKNEIIEYVAEPKYDGVSIELIYENGELSIAATRGTVDKEIILRKMQKQLRRSL